MVCAWGHPGGTIHWSLFGGHQHVAQLVWMLGQGPNEREEDTVED